MSSRSTLRVLFASVLVATVVLIPATAWAACTFDIEPNVGWRGAEITIEGFGMTPGDSFYVNFGGNQIADGTVPGNGYVLIEYTIPGGFPVGTTNWFFGANICGMSESRDYTVNATAPTTTTTTTTTLPPETTTTAAVTTTTVAATTTTAAATTTTAAGDTTTVVAGDTTTTTVPDEGDEDGGGGVPIYVWAVIAVLGGAVVFLLGKMSSRGK